MVIEHCIRDRPFITSVKELSEWVRKMAIYTEVQYFIYADIVGGSEKVQSYADVIYGWSLRMIDEKLLI